MNLVSKQYHFYFKENNAIAVVDLGTENVTAIHGLGFKNWGNSKLDASDKDGGNEFVSFIFKFCIKSDN